MCSLIHPLVFLHSMQIADDSSEDAKTRSSTSFILVGFILGSFILGGFHSSLLAPHVSSQPIEMSDFIHRG